MGQAPAKPSSENTSAQPAVPPLNIDAATTASSSSRAAAVTSSDTSGWSEANETDEQRAARIAFEQRQAAERKKRKDAQLADFAVARAQLHAWLAMSDIYKPQMSLKPLPGAIYIPNFLSAAECETAFKEMSEIGGNFRGISGFQGPRVKVYHPKRTGLDGAPATLKLLIPRVLDAKFMAELPMQVSVNYYPSGKHGMVAHKDGSGFQAVILTLGSSAMLDFYHQPEGHVVTQTQVYEESEVKTGYVTSVYQRPGGLLLMTGSCFTDFAHAIEARDEDIVNEHTCNRHLLGDPSATPLSSTTPSTAPTATADPPASASSTSSAAVPSTTTTSSDGGLAVGTRFPRGGRVSIVMWSG